MRPDAKAEAPVSLNLKGSMTAHALLQVPAEADLQSACQALTTLLAEDGPALQYTPCILAFPERTHLPNWLSDWVERLRAADLVPFAVQCATEEDQQLTHSLGLADMPVPEPSFRRPRPAHQARLAAQVPPMVVRQQVRSGQQIYAQGGDLVIMASVSAGAEVMADGHIHIHGDLRGRALAGVKGHQEARIYCRHLDGELVAIAGVYMMQEQFPEQRDQVEVSLENDQLAITGSTAR